MSKIYCDYIEETEKELWDSQDELYKYFSETEAYNKLLSGELGDNLIRKYKTRILYECFVPTVNLLYFAIENMIRKDITAEIDGSLNAAKSWMVNIRDIKLAFQNEHSNDDDILDLSYDVNRWYKAGLSANPLTSYRTPSRYKIFYDTKKLDTILSESKMLFGDDLSFRVGKLLTNWSIKNFWRQCEQIT